MSMAVQCLMVFYKNHTVFIFFNSPIFMLAKAPDLFALSIEISTIKKSLSKVYWPCDMSMLCAPDNFPNRQIASLAALLLSNSFYLPQWNECMQILLHLLPMSFRAATTKWSRPSCYHFPQRYYLLLCYAFAQVSGQGKGINKRNK